jgi:PAS domain S-box-containing protein
VALCLASARRAGPGIERRRLLLVALAASLPLISIAILMAGLTTPETHPTPADIGVSAALLVAAIVRYRFLEPSPIAAREILSHLQEGLVLMSPTGAFLDANPAALQILGRPLEALRGHEVEEWLSAVEPALPIALPRDARGHPMLPETAVETRDGRFLDLSGATVTGSDGRAVGQFLVIRDRTQQQRAEQRRHRSQRLESLGVIAAGIAHEINNPLAFVRTNLAHLRGIAAVVQKHAASFDAPERQPLEEMQEIVEETMAGVDRIAGIVASTRRLSRQANADRAPIDVNRVCRDALRLAACDDQRRVAFEAAFEPDLPWVRGSADQIGQVILNLLVNARQAVIDRDGGRVRLETHGMDGGVEIRVHDNGAGVPAADRERVFDPFFTTKDPDQGTGLGLTIAHEIARFHDGSLEVADSDLGGACFTLRLPL